MTDKMKAMELHEERLDQVCGGADNTGAGLNLKNMMFGSAPKAVVLSKLRSTSSSTLSSTNNSTLTLADDCTLSSDLRLSNVAMCAVADVF